MCRFLPILTPAPHYPESDAPNPLCVVAPEGNEDGKAVSHDGGDSVVPSEHGHFFFLTHGLRGLRSCIDKRSIGLIGGDG
jgi:hypothetical protein